MATAVTGYVQAILAFSYSKTADLSTAREDLLYNHRVDFTDDTAYELDTIFSDNLSLAGTGSTTLDLAGGLTDIYGAAITFTNIKGIFIRNHSSESGQKLNVGGAAANGWYAGYVADSSDKRQIPAGGFDWWMDPDNGSPVVAGTGDLLLIANTGTTTATFDIIIMGATT